jgi:hypothetical protein
VSEHYHPAGGAPVDVVDSHAHVLDPVAYPFSNLEGYRPGPNECGTAQEFRTVLAAHRLTHALVVNPFAGYATRLDTDRPWPCPRPDDGRRQQPPGLL